ncbi:Hsp20/alpha crystallin family protein [Streptomyces sp. NPDC086554]|uniref:Hsp20/alpha crystallin family protein n=1 Tax=Streptomyces sp. NPDC086554 TaxID=3154864 RepID=UPI003432CCBF
MMLIRTDPFRELDRLTQQFFGTVARPAPMPLDAYRDGDTFLIHLDLPGIEAQSLEMDVEQNVLTIRAERRAPELKDEGMIVAERPHGVFSRQLFLGDTLDTERIEAAYDAGVLTVRIPVAEQAKPRRIEISRSDGGAKQITT